MTNYNQPGFNVQIVDGQQQTHPAYPAYPNAGQPPYMPTPNQNSSYQPFPQPIQQQQQSGPMVGVPMTTNWLAGDFATYLTNSKALHIAQKKELLEVIVGWESPNKYSVKDEFGNKIFYVGEDSNVCGRQCFGKVRSFRLDVRDKAGVPILMIDRSLDCDMCCGLLCPDEVQVSTPTGQILGYVRQNFAFFKPSFSILDANRTCHLTIEGPFCPFSCVGGNVDFHVMTANEARVGLVSKQWTNIIREWFTDCDNFYVSYPQDLHVSLKAVCMAAAFLIVSMTLYLCIITPNELSLYLFISTYSLTLPRFNPSPISSGFPIFRG